MTKVMLPELGDDIVTATLACWHVKEGDEVAVDDDLAEVVTDKATFNISAEVSGTLEKICVPLGQEVAIGTVLAHIKEISA